MNNPHQNAGTTVFSRMLLVERIREGTSVGEAAEQFGVSRRTVGKWLARFRAGGDARVFEPPGQGADGCIFLQGAPHGMGLGAYIVRGESGSDGVPVQE